MKQPCQPDYDLSVQPQPKHKKLFSKVSKIRIPRWFRDFFWKWAAGMLLLIALGYAVYCFSGGWTPDHLIRFIFMGV